MKWKHGFSFLTLLCACFGLIAQNGSYANPIGDAEKRYIVKQLNDRFWGVDKSSYRRDIPVEYATNDVVILNQTLSKEYYRNSRNYLRTINLEHKVILVQTRAGLDKNSVFSYEHINSDLAFDVTAIKVIKPDGRERILDLDSIAITKSHDKVEYRKFIVPGLEVGDILDFYYYLEFRVLFPQQYSRVFDPVYLLPQGEDPILNYKLEFILGPSAFVNARTHEFPDFEAVNYKIDRKTFSKYSLSLNNLDPIDLKIKWFYPFRELPNIRFQVFIGPYSGNSDIVYNLGGSLKLNSDIQFSRLQDYLAYSLTPGRDFKVNYTQFLRYLKYNEIKRKKLEKNELAYQYYYFLRAQRELAGLNNKQVITDPYQFVSWASYALSKLHVKHDVVMAFDRSLTGDNQFILTDEITPMIRILESDTLILVNPVSGNVPNEVGAKFEHTKAYSFDPSTLNLGKLDMSRSKARENEFISEINLEIAEDGRVSIENNFTVAGQQKPSWQRQLLNRPEMFINGSAPNYGALLAHSYPKKKLYTNTVNNLKTLAETREAQINNSIEARLLDELGEIQDLYWDVLEPGITIDEPALSWQVSYTSDQVASKANNSYLIPIHKLVPSSKLPAIAARERKPDLYFDYPQSNSCVIYLKELSGYNFGEIERLNREFNNASGSFQSSAKLVQDGLLVTCNYTLLNYKEPAENLKNVLEILEAYRNFTEQKILYRRK